MTDSISSAEFCQVLAQFASGVTIVAAADTAGPVGLTATSFTSTSLVPPLVLVCVGRAAGAHDRLVGAKLFGISVLDERQIWIAEQFACPGIDRFQGVALRPAGAERVPLIDGALVRLECRRQACHRAGDHTILVGEVLQGWLGAGQPLVRFAHRFGSFSPMDRREFEPPS